MGEIDIDEFSKSYPTSFQERVENVTPKESHENRNDCGSDSITDETATNENARKRAGEKPQPLDRTLKISSCERDQPKHIEKTLE